jgi:hypothetical protein
MSDFRGRNVSMKFWAFITVCAYFAYSQYMLFRSLIFSGDLLFHFSAYQALMKETWWITVFYASELGGTVGGILRSAATMFAVYSAWRVWREGDNALTAVKGKVGVALLLEAGYFLSFIPTVVLGFVFPSTGGCLWYFDSTPVFEVFYVAGLSCLAMVLVIPFVLFKLWSKVTSGGSEEVVRWSLIAAVSYLFVVFWWDSLMQWTGMVASFGSNLLSDPVNFIGFVTVVFGLFFIAVSGLVSVMPTIKVPSSKLNLKRAGAVMMAFGGYFVFGITLYFLSGGFAARPSAWYEMIVPHNPYLWCIVFLFAGLAVLRRKD